MGKVITAEVQIKTGASKKDIDDLTQGVEKFNAEVATTNTKAVKGFKGVAKRLDYLGENNERHVYLDFVKRS